MSLISAARSSCYAMILGFMSVAGIGIIVSACEWFHGTNLNGIHIDVNAGDPEYFIHHLTQHKASGQQWQKHADELVKKLQSGGDWHDRSDYAAVLMHLGAAAKSIEILTEVEQHQPGEYVTAANLGTAYELSGNNELAREWIIESIARNANSHYGTEWLHVKILDAKIALAADPNWLKSHSILGLDFGSADAPAVPESEAYDYADFPRNLPHVTDALAHQLHERMGFVPAPDPVVADLLVDLANALAITRTLEHAAKVYELALTYAPRDTELIKRRLAYCQFVIAHPSGGRTEDDSPRAALNGPEPQQGEAAKSVTPTVAPGSSRKVTVIVLAVVSALLAGALGLIAHKDRKRAAAYRARHSRV
jgi:tetratricopeptide (TPR) repeat protein